jgi:hypothetical protein
LESLWDYSENLNTNEKIVLNNLALNKQGCEDMDWIYMAQNRVGELL